MQNIQPSIPSFALKKQTLLIFCVMLPFCMLLFFAMYLFKFEIFNFDTQLMRLVHQFTNPILDQVAITLSYLGGMPAAMVLMFLLIGHSWIKKTKNVFFIFISMIGATSISWLLKVLVDRPRPMLWPRLVQDYGASFPSGHSVYAAAFASLFILMCWRTKWRLSVSVFAMMWMLSMGLSRVYLGVHYPSDVLAGWALGWGWVFLVYFSLSQIKINLIKVQ